MKIILTTIILFLLISNISYSKDNPLKIFKKEILGEEAKKKMSLAYDSITKHNKILKYNEEEKAIEITLDSTIYLECWMTGAKIKKMIAKADSKKAFFSEFK